MWRDSTKLHHFESVVEMAAYNLGGGLKDGKAIESAVIDHYVPFLPLEKVHVEQCVHAEFIRNGKHPTANEVQEVMNYVAFDKSGLFSTSGCKRLEKKVQFIIDQRSRSIE